MRKLIFTLSLICVLLNAKWIIISDSKPEKQFTLTRANDNEVILEFNLDGFEIEKEYVNGQEYSVISHPLPNDGVTMDIGKPQVPVFSTFVETPGDWFAQITMENTRYRTYDNILIKPSQPLPTESGDETYLFEIDQLLYEKNSVYPVNEYFVNDPVIIRDARAQQIVIHPIRTMPKSKKLSILESATIRVKLYRGSTINVKHTQRPLSLAFEPLLNNLIINHNISISRTTDYQQPCYLFVIPPSLDEADIASLTEWKKEKGHEVHIVSSGDLEEDAENIKDYILDAYNSWENPPEFVCLVGDIDDDFAMPTFFESISGYWGEGDHPYGLLEGDDDFADLFVGRLSIRIIQQLDIEIDKILHYEREPAMDNTDWFTHALLVGDPSQSGISCVITKRFCKDIMEDEIPNLDELYVGDFDLQISEKINEGTTFVNYRGIWGTSEFTIADINALENGYMLPFATFITCATGSFSSSTCQSEAFLRAGTIGGEPKGAVAAISVATNGTHTTFNNCIDGGIYYGIFVEGINTAGGALNRGKISLHHNYPSNPENYPYIFSHWLNLMGDPGLELWTGIPQTLVVTYPETIQEDIQLVTIQVQDVLGNPIENSWVCVYQSETDTQEFSVTNLWGTAVFSLTSFSLGSAKVTVSGKNLLPHLGEIEFIETTSLVNFSEIITIDEDGNGQINSGETVDFHITLKNFGFETVTGINTTISCNDEDASVQTGQIAFPDLEPDETATQIFTVVFADGLVGDMEFLFSVNIQSDIGNWTDFFFVQISAPFLEIESWIASEPNGDDLDPGESGELNLTLINSGTVVAESVTALLRVLDTRIIVSDSIASLGTIEIGSFATTTSPFMFFVNLTTFPGSQIPVTIQLTDENGYNEQISLILGIGDVAVTDPLGSDPYGYFCYDSGDLDYPAAPEYDWVEINDNANNLYISDTGDNFDESQIVDLPFMFTFYGVEYDHITVCSNGWLSFGTTYQSVFRNWALPGPLGPPAMVAAFWDDLITTDGAIYSYYDEDNHRYIVEWDNMKTYYANSTETFQVILYDPEYYETPTGDGEIVIQYETFNNTTAGDYDEWNQIHGNYCTVGLEDNTCMIGLQYTFNNSYPEAAMVISDDTALKFTTVGGFGDSPSASINVSELNYSIDTDQQTSDSFMIFNSGEGTLMYELSINHDTAGDNGPDNFGHYWCTSNENENINYEWIDIAEIGTEIIFPHNDYAPEISFSIEFPFQYYGEEYSELIINPNGWVGFGSDNNEWQNTDLPNTFAPKPAIFAFWDDLNPLNDTGNGNGSVFFYSSDEHTVIWFNDVTHYEDTGPYNFQTVLYPDHTFRINYNTMEGNTGSATIGIQNSAGDDALLVDQNGEFAHDGLTISFEVTKNWIQFEEPAGLVESNSTETVNITIDSQGLGEGIYEADIHLATNDPENPMFIIPTTLNIGTNCFGWGQGDPNNDENFNVLDVIMIINFIMGQNTPDTCQFWAADLNEDEILNVLDVIQVVGIILGE